MRTRIALVSVVLMTATSSSVLSISSSIAIASEELCFGQVPTLVGTPGEIFVGTDGPDVVVTNGAWGGKTQRGNDLLCITGVAPIAEPFYGGTFDTEEGNDRIDATGGEFPYPLSLTPGPGQDEVLAGAHMLQTGEVSGVYVNAREDSVGDADADIIETGQGTDTVDAAANDVVDLGADKDLLYIFDDTGDATGGQFIGGDDGDFVNLILWGDPWTDRDEHYSWKINNRAGRITRDGQLVALMSGFSEFDVSALGPMKFIGSDLPETIFSDMLPPEVPLGSQRTNWPRVWSMHGGDDVVGYNEGGADSRFEGGEGTDRFSFIGPYDSKEASLNLASGALRYNFLGSVIATQAVGFENVRWWSGADATIIGTGGPNKIVTRGQDPRRDMAVYGKGGDDILRTGLGKDVLIGGQGHDSADGGGGFDRCKAEVRTHCEE